MSDIIKEWYEKKDNIDEMGQWNSNGLKRWEQFITAYFPVKAHILDVGCGMGRESGFFGYSLRKRCYLHPRGWNDIALLV